MKICKIVLKFLGVGAIISILFIGFREMWLMASQAVNSGGPFSVIWGFLLFLLMATILILGAFALTAYLRVRWFGITDEDDEDNSKDNS